MSAEENMALARRFLEARGKGNLDAIDEMMAPDFVDHTLAPGQEPDREAYKRQVAEYAAAFSDLTYTIEDQVAGADKVVTRFTVSGTHDRRALVGVAPTGRKETNMAIAIHRIVRGKIAEEWGVGTSISEVREGFVARWMHLEQERIERELLEQELRVARRIQQASLPKEVPTLEGWQIAPFYQPAREVGGDFYDFHLLSDGRVGLAVGDATGHGIPAALVVSTTSGMLRLAAQSYSSPGEMLQRVNEALVADIPPSTFVTCFYAILDLQSGHLVYANAGHNLPCRRHEHAVAELKARGMPLGLMPKMSYEEKETVLVPGESVLFYTDGLIEAHNPQREMLGVPRLRGLLGESSKGGRDLSATLMEELGRFTGEGWEQEDDITLLTLERSARRS